VTALAEVARYFQKIVRRVLMIGLAALAGAVGALMVILMPLLLLHEIGATSLDTDKSGLTWPILLVGAFWGVAHMLDEIVENVHRLERGGGEDK